MGRDIDRIYLEGVIGRSKQALQRLVAAMHATKTTEIQYFIQQSAPVIVQQLDRAQALRRSL